MKVTVLSPTLRMSIKGKLEKTLEREKQMGGGKEFLREKGEPNKLRLGKFSSERKRSHVRAPKVLIFKNFACGSQYCYCSQYIT